MWGGLDLAASPRRPSGIVVGAEWTSLKVLTAYEDEEILAHLAEVSAVWVDAPLTFSNKAFRDCDRKLQMRGIATLPLTWPSMQGLYRRASTLQRTCREIQWHETFPWSLYRWLTLSPPRKKEIKVLAQWTHEKGLVTQPASVHEWDALACWIIGWLAFQGKAEQVCGEEGVLWIPHNNL
ncbi:MAG: DUF429 domain-containing protein [Bacteroidia bacterium]|nr:DUF429 domain-containing protein [Bacteroidia bacterium]MDW8015699.1 DUF429 domain-containing protein [Bacteroidia bacterium]